MSLVGPRPVVPDELALYGEAKIYYLQVRPGLTGLWQISGRNDLDYERRVSSTPGTCATGPCGTTS